jgi:hypothetical protein
MGDNSFTQLKRANGDRKVDGWVQFTTASTSAVTGVDGEGYVTAARTGVGVFRITLPFACKSIIPKVNQGGAAAAQLGTATIRAVSASGKTIDIAVVELDGTPADIETTGLTIYCEFTQRFA